MSDDFDSPDAVDEPDDDDGPSTGILDRDSPTVNIGGRQYVVRNVLFEPVGEEESAQPLTFSQSPFLELFMTHCQTIQDQLAHPVHEPATEGELEESSLPITMTDFIEEVSGSGRPTWQTIQDPRTRLRQGPATDDRHPSEIPVVETEIGQSAEAQEVRRQVTLSMESLATGIRNAQALGLSDEQLQRARNAFQQLASRDAPAVPFPTLGQRAAEDRRRAMRVSALAEDALVEAESAIQDLRFVTLHEGLHDAGEPAVEDVLADLDEVVSDLSALRDRIATDPELFPQQPKAARQPTDTGPVSAARFSGLADEREEDA